MFGRIGNVRPEDFPKQFRVYRRAKATNGTGRVVDSSSLELVCTIRGILSVASPHEIDRFNQIGVTVTHKVIEWGCNSASVNDELVLMIDGAEKRKLRIMATHNRGEMSVCSTYYCYERSDVK